MEARELRIGNLVNFDGGIIAVNIKMLGFMVNSERLNQLIPFEPISLTDELLLKCGFKKSNSEMICGDFIMQKFYDGYHYTGGEGCMDGVPILYLHQLQNIYFAITGEELKIEL